MKRNRILLVEIAFEAAIPFGVRSGDGESGEKFGERARWRGPVDLAEGVHEVLRCYVAPIHGCLRILQRNPRKKPLLIQGTREERTNYAKMVDSRQREGTVVGEWSYVI